MKGSVNRTRSYVPKLGAFGMFGTADTPRPKEPRWELSKSERKRKRHAKVRRQMARESRRRNRGHNR